MFSDTENRVLEQTPHFSFNQLFHGNYTGNYEKYIADQFTFRDFWIGVKSDYERALGSKESNGVYLGKDGYLLQHYNKLKENDFRDKIEVINNLAKRTPDINKYFMMVPNSVEILRDKLPRYAPVDDELADINRVRDSLDRSIKYVDVYSSLYAKRNDYIYYKTDHHWTTKGAFYAYEGLEKEMGISTRGENHYNITEVSDNFYGTLYSEGGFRGLKPDSVELYIPKVNQNYTVEYYDEKKITSSLYNMNNLIKKDKYSVFFGGNSSLIKISTDNKSGKKLLIIKDSYANCFIPFLTEDFSEIYVVDPRYYDQSISDLVKGNSISELLILYNAKTFFEDPSISNIS